MPSKTLPAEVTDHIIDFFHDDKKSLQSTSLVCRSWCPRSRFNLFRTITIRIHEQDLEEFLLFLLHDKRQPRHSQPVARSIRALRLCGPYFAFGRHDLDPSTLYITPKLLLDLLNVLTEVKELSLSDIALDAPVHLAVVSTSNASQEPTATHAVSRRTLEVLTMKNIGMHSSSGEDFARILALFSSVSTLRISSPFWPGFPFMMHDIPINPTVPVAKIPDIATLDLNARVVTPYLLALLRQVPRRTIREVRVVCSMRVEVQSFGRFLDEIGPSVEQLSIDYDGLLARNHIDSPEHLQEFNIGACSALSMLTLRLTLHTDSAHFSLEHNTGCFFVLTQLLGYTPPSLRTLVIRVDLPGQGELGRLQSLFEHALDAELQWLRLALRQRRNVEEVRFLWDGAVDSLEYTAQLDAINEGLRSKLSDLDHARLSFGTIYGYPIESGS
ncbi:hypothetical protein NM688_g5138 [Phlebia brevispora]|uniref:Uncharacterized protein n=1 Tax=Phlebia brevispora TaxID=194682 RepID=A0ACC1T081_9APHY|nr:hypothetical protein NM688_g5138 [Phlebia brevispora]